MEGYRIIIGVGASLKFLYELFHVTFVAVKSALYSVAVLFVYVIRRVIVEPADVFAERRNGIAFAAKVYIRFYAELFDLFFTVFGDGIEMRRTIVSVVRYFSELTKCFSSDK